MTVNTTLRAFHGAPAIKATYLARVTRDAAQDRLIHGVGWQNGRGCAVGCTLHRYDHTAYETELGIPAHLAHLEDVLFEAQTNDAAQTWPRRFLEAIPVGADLSGVWPRFAAWMMDDPTYGVMYTTDDAEIRDLAAEVALRYQAGDTEGSAADDLANRLRAAWAARAARDARAASAAWDARAAWAAWGPWDARVARVAFVKASADMLLALLASAPTPEAPERARRE